MRLVFSKLLHAFLVLAGVVVLVFFLFQLVRFNPAYSIAGESASQETIQVISKELGTHLPVTQQLFYYLNQLSPISRHHLTNPESRTYIRDAEFHYFSLLQTSNYIWVLKWPYLGRSFQSGRPVSEILNQAIPNTLILAVSAMLLATMTGVVLGMTAAVYQGTNADKWISAFSVLGVAIPSFFAAIVLQLVFGYWLSHITGLHITGNLFEPDPYTGQQRLVLQNLLLPAISLGIRPVAVITQITRSSMLEVLQTAYMRTAVAKGLSPAVRLYKHALRNALVPVITSVTGWLASLMAGAFFIEMVFNYQGLGLEAVQAIRIKDIPVAGGAVLYMATIFVSINLITDLLYAWTDPRMNKKKNV